MLEIKQGDRMWFLGQRVRYTSSTSFCPWVQKREARQIRKEKNSAAAKCMESKDKIEEHTGI